MPSLLYFRVGGFGNVRMPSAIYNEDQQKEVLGNNSGLMSYFFGKDRKGKIGKKEFYQFHKTLLDEVIELLFYEYEPNLEGHISEVEFCAFLLEHSSLTHSKKMKMLEKVKKKWPGKKHGISLEEFKNIYHVLAGGVDFERAIFYLDLNNQGIDLEEFKQVACWVSDKPPTPHVAEVMFLILDENGDGTLHHNEVAPILFDWRRSRGFEKSAVHILMGHMKV